MPPNIRVRGRSIPSGYLVGRTTPGQGDQQIVDMSSLAQQLVATGAIPAAGAAASTLAGLGDVDVSGVADGNALVYDAGSGLWIPGATGGGGTGLFNQVMSATPTTALTGLSTWVNQSTTTVTDAATGILLEAIGTNNSSTTRISARSKAALSTPYTVTALVALAPFGTFFPWTGIGWYDGTKFHVISYVCNTTNYLLRVDRFSTVTAFSASETGALTVPNSGLIWLRITDDGTNVIFYYSIDGANFVTLFTIAKASGYLGGSGYTNIIWYVNPQMATNPHTLSTLMSYAEG